MGSTWIGFRDNVKKKCLFYYGVNTVCYDNMKLSCEHTNTNPNMPFDHSSHIPFMGG